jgi:predicted phosphodiesterase
VISDLNGSYGSTHYEATVDAAVARIVSLKPDLVICTGDMVAGQRRPHLAADEIERMWKAFHRHVSDPLAAAGIPLAVTPGNHDGSAYRGFELERSAYADQWRPRRPNVRFLEDTGYPYHYAFALGDILFVSLDATTVGHLPREQMEWLRLTLAKHGPAHRRKILFSHLPLWPFAEGREREYIGDPELQALLEAEAVDVVLSGHHHAFYPGVMNGVAFIGQSCLGAGPRHLIGAPGPSPRSFTLIEVTADAVELAALHSPGFDSEIEWSGLPERVRTAAAELIRADLAGGTVTRLRAAGVQRDRR